MILGQYMQRDSIIHKLDPRTKMLVVFMFVIIIFMADSLWGYTILTIFALLTSMLTSIPFKYLAKGLKPVWWLMGFTFLLHLIVTREGEVLFNIIGWNIHLGGVIKGLEISLRFFLLILMTTNLTLTTPPIAITDAVESLLKPLKKVKVPVHELALMMSISLRFIPTLMQEMDKISKAQAARGLDFSTGKLKDRAQAILPLFIPLFINAFRRAEDLAIAMEARGYRGGDYRTKFRELAYQRQDFLASLFFILMVCLFCLIKF
ncbi:energy-coupling factor transporter transmembrane component T family protein [Piscibacillus sp. B03]|uniref:energy-coupling factor transporter transmembrane component T family protein n=1 Tax=Piscibacillus sp. B03 TaxID=3457430 RepID=UPI003FCEC09A